MASSRSRVEVWAVMLAALACNGHPAAPVLAACHADVVPLVLNVAADSAMDPLATSGCILIAANASTTDSAEYLLVPQASTTSPDYHSSFKLAGGAPITAAIAAQLQAVPASPAERFHDRLRLMEQEGAYPVPAGSPGPSGAVAPSVQRAAAPDTVLGSQWPFKVLSNLTNSSFFITVNATAKSVGQHVILYVDNLAPSGGLSTAELDKLRSDFDTLLYATDTTAFGRESDIDHNQRVIVLMSNVINKLVTTQECVNTGYVTGFFFPADLAPSTRTMWNNGEIFYTVVPDSSGTLSCAHPNSQVTRVVPVTFIHEFQHMISFNQHVLLRGQFAEMLWLNEGMSHYAEELGGRVFLKAGNNTRYCEHVRGDLYNFGLYLTSPGASGLVASSGIGGLAERGAWWAFVRYLVDQFAADTGLAAAAAFTRQLAQTSATGADNVAQRTGVPFAILAKRWVLANWVSDLPGFTAPSTMKYKHWAFRSDFPALHASCNQSLPATFPLAAPASPPAGINVVGTIFAGSAGTYQRALQGPGDAPIRLLFSDSTGAQLLGSVLPRLNVLRIR